MTNRYERIVDGKVVEVELETLDVTWYYPHELELFLEKAGFSDIQMQRGYSGEEKPSGLYGPILYECVKA